MARIDRDASAAQVEILAGRGAGGAVDARERLSEVGALPDAVGVILGRDVDRVVDGIDRHSGDVDRSRPEEPAPPVPSVILGLEESAARERARVHAAGLLRIEGDPSGRARRQSVAAAVLPASPAVLRDEEATVIRAQEDVPVVRWIDRDRMPALAVAVLQLLPGQPAPSVVASGVSGIRRFPEAVRMTAAGSTNAPSKFVAR